ncbi:MAG TPA: hypothetical protein VM101_03330 [Flavitalea sp.]|nr:hypothetical protein [Flavitalea sp.]
MNTVKKYIRFRKNLTRLRKRIYNKVIWTLRANMLMYRTMLKKECYFGPFTGEFGHLLGHNLPFISYLYSKGVKVHYCGMEIHRPFFVEEKGNEIVETYLSVRDFFDESLPNCNTAEGPHDVNSITSRFINKAKKSGLPYWDNSEFNYYFDYFRWWILEKRYMKTFDLSKVYRTTKLNAAVIFPRKMNVTVQNDTQLHNNGQQWDYYRIAKAASKNFDRVFVIGHPAFSDVAFGSFDNVEVNITNDNGLILELCSNSRLIISQHSGSVYLGEYTNTPVLIIYKGGRDIGNIQITNKFKAGLGTKHNFRYAYTYDEIGHFINEMTGEKIRN